MALSSLHLQASNLALLLAFTVDCQVSGNSLDCRLLGLLHVLNVLGLTLVIVLAAVVLFAIRAWIASRHSGEFPPQRSTHKKAGRS